MRGWSAFRKGVSHGAFIVNRRFYSPFILLNFFILIMAAACGSQNDQVSKTMTPAEVQKQKKLFVLNLSEYLPEKVNTQGSALEEAAWEKSIVQQKQAEQTNYVGVIPDGAIKAAEETILKKQAPQLTPPELSNQPQASDVSPITLIKNLLCKKEGQCLPALDPAIEQAVGYYYFRADLGFGGKLINGVQMPLQGNGFLVKGNSQNMRWSTDHAVRFVQVLAETMQDLKLTPTLVVGDVSQFGGGFNTGHASHQNGLDVDIGFLGTKDYNLPTTNFPKDMVVNDQVTSHFGLVENWMLVNIAIKTNWTLFAIAHPAVKQAFCELAKAGNDFEKYKPILARILPDKSHFDHVHFRLKCPISSPACIPADFDFSDPGCK